MPNQNALKINDDLSAIPSPLIQAISSGGKNRLKIKKFVFLTNQSVKKMSTGKFVTWKPPCLRNEGKRMYIECYVKVPPDLPPEVQVYYKAPGTWHRFRIFRKINSFKDAEYVKDLLIKLEKNLEDGYTPFEDEIKELNRIKAMVAEEEKAKKKLVTINAAYDAFLAQYDDKSKPFYAAPLNLLKKFLSQGVPLQDSQWYQSIESLSYNDLEDFMIYGAGKKEWAPNTYNDKVNKLITFSNFCKAQCYITDSPAQALKRKKKGTTVKHTPFEDDIIPTVKEAILKVPYWGKHLHDFSEVVYYTCTRPDKETRQLQIKHILWGRHIIDITNEIAKGGNGRHIFMVPELEELFIKMKLKSYPPEYYIFGKEGPPGPEPTSEAHYSTLFRKEVREPKKLSDQLTIYSWKHTRCIHLWLANSGLAAIQQLCGHSKPSMTEEYLSKGLGLMLGKVTHEVKRAF